MPREIEVEGRRFTIDGDTPTESEALDIRRTITVRDAPPPTPVPGARVGPAAPGIFAESERRVLEAFQADKRRERIENLKTGAVIAGSAIGTIGLAGTPGGLTAMVLGKVGTSLAARGITGGAFMAGAASIVFDTAVEAGRFLGFIPRDDAPQLTPSALAANASRETALDAVTGVVGLGLIPGARLAQRRFLGIATSKAGDVAEVAARFRVGIGIQDVSTKRIVTGPSRILGKIPFFTRPFTRAGVSRQAEAKAAERELMDMIAPEVGMSDIGTNLTRASKNTFLAWDAEGSKLFNDAWKLARESNSVIPVSNTKSAAQQIVTEFGEARPILETGKKLPPAVRTRIVNWAGKLAKLADVQDPDQYRALLKDLRFQADRAAGISGSPTELELVVRIKRAMELDLEAIQGPQQVVEELRAARLFWARGMRFFANPTSSKFKRVDKRIFKSKNPLSNFEEADIPEAGSSLPDQMFKIAFRADSPQSLTQLHALTRSDPDVFRSALRAHLDDVFQANTTQGRVDVAGVRKALGLDRPNSGRAAATRTALVLAGTKVTPKLLDDFLDVAEAAFKLEIPNPSALIEKRTALGGVASGVRAFTVGAGVLGAGASVGGGIGLGSAGAVISAIIAARGIGRFVTNPKRLLNATRALDPTLPQIVRRTAMAKLVREAALLRPGVTLEDVRGEFAKRDKEQARIEALQNRITPRPEARNLP